MVDLFNLLKQEFSNVKELFLQEPASFCIIFVVIFIFGFSFSYFLYKHRSDKLDSALKTLEIREKSLDRRNEEIVEQEKELAHIKAIVNSDEYKVFLLKQNKDSFDYDETKMYLRK